MPTRTHAFPVGFRQGYSDWQKSAASLAAWAKQNHFEALDLRDATPADVAAVSSAGLKLGTVDLIEMGKLVDSDAPCRRDLIHCNIAHVKSLAALGVRTFFTVVLGNKTLSRRDNYTLAVESFTPIAQAAEDAGAKIVVEGWPGRAPTYPGLCCTPETYRSFIQDVNPRSVGVNYDPSHLIRLGVDPIRFLREFAPHVHHVHAKDTELIPEAVYEYGLYQPAVFTPPHVYGEHAWRYTIPGQGLTRWPEVFKILKDFDYPGVVSIELEDENFHGSEEREKSGLLHSLAFLTGA